MSAFKSMMISLSLLCFSTIAVGQHLPWQDQIAVYSPSTYGMHIPYFLVGTTFYDVHLDYLSSNPYTVTLAQYGLSAPGTPEPAFYSVLANDILTMPVVQSGSTSYEAFFNVINKNPYTFQLYDLRVIPTPNPIPACGFVPQADPKLEGLMSRMRAKMTANVGVTDQPSGAIVAVVKDGQLISAEGLGMRSKTTYGMEGLTVTRETLFWIASTSKFVAAVGAMTLVDDSSLNIAAPVTDYIPEFTEESGREHLITMDKLLKMKSGLNNDGGCNLLSHSPSVEPGGCASVASSISDDQVLENLFQPSTLSVSPWSIFNDTVHGTPGLAPWAYSNWGYMLAGRVMEVVSGQRYPQLIQDRVFDPASMCLATYDPAEVIAYGNYAIGSWTAAADGQCPEPELGHDSYAPWMADEMACPARSPNGGARASAIDLGNFAKALLNDLNGSYTVLSHTAANQLINPSTGRTSTGGSFWGDTYGYGNFHHTYNGYDIYSHAGGRAGFGTMFWIIPSENFGIAVSLNIGYTNYFNPELEYAVRCYLDNQCN